MRWRFPGPITQMLCALAAGLLLGWADPALAVRCKPVSDLFIAAINLLMAPIIFVTVAGGISRMGSLRQFGRVGLHAFIYFEVMSVLSLSAGLAAGWLLQPGAAFPIVGAAMTTAPSVRRRRRCSGPLLPACCCRRCCLPSVRAC